MCDRCEKIGWDSTREPVVTGGQFGIDFYDFPYTIDGKSHRNPQFRVFSEDDGNWHFTGFSASIHWLQDLLTTVSRAMVRADNETSKA